jgi:transposase
VRRRCAKKSGGQDAQALGRSRGGFGTKVHVAVTGLGLPAAVVLSPGQDADVTHAGEVLGDARPAVVVADKGYGSRPLVRLIRARGAEVVIPSRKNRAAPRVIDADRYKDRNLVERFGAKAKQYRRVATRYEKTARNLHSLVHL